MTRQHISAHLKIFQKGNKTHPFQKSGKIVASDFLMAALKARKQ